MAVTLHAPRDDPTRVDTVTADFVRYRTRGDLVALGRVFDALAPQLLSLGLHLCGHAADAEDALQSAFVVAMRKAGTFDAAQPLAPWLAGILAGEARNLMRRAGRRRTAPLDDVAGGDADPAAVAERRELVRELRTRIGVLPEEQRQALLLQLEYGLQPAQIAEVLAVPPGTVRMRLHRGLRALRRLLPAGFAVWAFGALSACGLAGVRRAVLVEGKKLAGAGAASAAGVGAGLALGGAFAMKNLLVGAGFVLLAVLLWCVVPWPGGGPAPATASQDGAVATAPVAAASPAAAESAEEPAANERTPLDEPTGSVLVRVRFAGTGEPVPGAMAQLYRPEPAVRWSRQLPTDARGEVRFARVPAAELVFDCSPDGNARVKLPSGGYTYARGARSTVEVPAGGEVVFEHELPLGGIVSGRTVDDAGRPVGGAEILTTGSPDIGHARSEMWRTIGRSAADGSFRVGLVRNECGLAARTGGYAPSTTQVLDPDPVRDLTVTLVLPRAHGQLAGTVRDGKGAPLSGVSVTLAGRWSNERGPDGAELRPCPPRSMTTGDDGAFSFTDLACASHRLFVESRAAGHAIVDLRIQPGRNLSPDVVLGTPAALRCTVRDGDGRPVPGARVRVGKPDGREAGERRTDAQGRCEFAQLAPGSTSVRAAKAGIGGAKAVVELDDGGRAECELALVPSPAFRGRLLGADGDGLGGWTVVAVDDEDWRATDVTPSAPEEEATTGQRGAFEIVDLEEHRHRLLAVPPGTERDLGTVPLAEHVMPSAEVRTFVVAATVLPTASVLGVVLGPDLQPRQGVVLLLRRRDVPQSRGRSAETGADGAFAFGPLLPGPYELEVRADGFAAVPRQEFLLAARESHDLGSIRLRTGTRLVVRVLGTDGEPWPHKLPNVLVERTRADGGSDQQGGFAADGGVLRSPPLLPGHVRLLVRDDNLFAWPVEADVVEGQETAVDLQVQVGTERCFRFDVPAAARSLRLEARDGHGHVLRDVAKHIGGLGAVMQLALVPGTWTVTGDDDLGNRYHATVEVEDLERVDPLDRREWIVMRR